MHSGRVTGTTRVLGASQGYLSLPVRDEMIQDATTKALTPSMVTAWFPTPSEIKALNDGAPVLVRILGVSHPPIIVTAGKTPSCDY